MATFTYSRQQPVAADDLDISQPFLTQNTNSSDSVFGLDHYAFSDVTANQGFHKQVTTVVQGSIPTTTANPILYAYQQTAPLGALQFSRGPTDAVPSPVTTLQSSSTPITLAVNATTNVLDFTGISNFIGYLYITYQQDSGGYATLQYFIAWNGSQFFGFSFGGNGLGLNQSGNIVQIKNASLAGHVYNNIYWTFHLLRTS